MLRSTEHPDDIMVLERLKDLRANKHHGELAVRFRDGRITFISETVTKMLDISGPSCNTDRDLT